MGDTDNGHNNTCRHGNLSNDMRDTFTLGAKLLAVLIAVSVLSIGVIACSFFFIYMCFMHPQSATILLPVLVPAGLGGVAICYGKKLWDLVVPKDDTKAIEKVPD